MKTSRLPALEGVILLTWLMLLALQGVGGLVDGMATFFLPISISILLFKQLRTSRPAFDLTIVFLASCLFFFCIGVILWPFSSFSPKEFSSLVSATFTWQQLDQAAILIGLSIAVTMATLVVMRRGCQLPVTPEFLNLNKPRHRGLYKIGVLCIVASLPAVTIESIEQLKFIRDAGYLALFSDGIPVSATSKAFFYLFDLGFGLTLTFARNRAEFLAPSVLFLIVATLDSLKGARGALLVPLLFVAWFYAARFNVKIKLLSVIRNLVIIVGVFAVMTFQRDPEIFNNNALQFAVDALTTQGRSLQLTALYSTVADEVAQFGNYTVFSNLLIPFIAVIHPEIREAAQSMDQVLYSNNLKHILTYVLNDSYYFMGGGTGGVYTIELIEAGPILYILLSMGLGWFLAWMPAAMHRPWVRYLSIYFFATIFYLPRGEFFFNILIVGKAILLYFTILFLYDIVRPRRYSIPSNQLRA